MITMTTVGLEVGYRRGRQCGRTLVGPLTVALRPGVLTCLLGPNGIGKSTLLRTLAGLQAPLAGQVLIGTTTLDRLPPEHRARWLGLVLTERAAVGALPLWSLVAMGRYPYTDWRGTLTAVDNAVVRGALETMGLTALAHCAMNALSDGERQKAMIARALAQEPKVLLLDEAMAYLDLPRRVELMQRLRELARSTGCAILLSCHDLDITLRYADRLWLIAQGGQLREGIPEDLVLNGGFEATFPTGASLNFDPYLGAFVPSRSPVARIAVEGEALSALWARRALERVGFEVVREDAEWRVVLSANRRHLPAWRLLGRSCNAGYGLESLLAALHSPTMTATKETTDELQ